MGEESGGEQASLMGLPYTYTGKKNRNLNNKKATKFEKVIVSEERETKRSGERTKLID